MHQDRIEDLFARMRDTAGGINSFVQEEVLDAMLRRAFDAVIPVLEAAHDRLADTGPAALADGVLARSIACPQGPHGGVWRKAVLLEGEGMDLLAVLKMGGEPNPAVDAIVRKHLGSGTVGMEPKAGS